MCIFSAINENQPATLTNSFLGDDLVLCLSSQFGEYIKANPTATLSISLVSGSTLAPYGFIPVLNNVFGSDFINARITGVIQATDLDAQPRGRYQAIVRINDGTLQKTFRLNQVVNLINLI